MGKYIKLFESFINENNSEIEDELGRLEYELDRLYDKGANEIKYAVSFLQSYYEEIGEEFDELTINNDMDVEDVIAELRKVKGDKQQEAENIIANIENINNQIQELENELEG